MQPTYRLLIIGWLPMEFIFYPIWLRRVIHQIANISITRLVSNPSQLFHWLTRTMWLLVDNLTRCVYISQESTDEYLWNDFTRLSWLTNVVMQHKYQGFHSSLTWWLSIPIVMIIASLLREWKKNEKEKKMLLFLFSLRRWACFFPFSFWNEALLFSSL